MMNVMNIVRTRVSMPSEATLLFCHCFVMDGSELIKSVGFQWESAVVCKLIFAVSPLLNRGVANFPIGGSSVSPLGACYWWCSEGFLSEAWVGIFHHAMVMPWLLSISFFSYLIWSVLKKLKLCSFQAYGAYLGWSNCYPTVYSHKFSASKATSHHPVVAPRRPSLTQVLLIAGVQWLARTTSITETRPGDVLERPSRFPLSM